MARTPDATAVVFHDTRLTFAEVDRCANRFAHMLRARGVGRETLVALYLERSAEAVVALLGVLKAGGAYLPLDATGSSGTPKGVEITHANLINNFLFWEETHRLSAMGSLAQTASFAFAVFQSDVFRALSLGLNLVICARDILLSPRLLFDLMRHEHTGFLEIVPSLMRTLLVHVKQRGERLDFLRGLVVSADRWYVREHREVACLLAPGARFSHVYGLSETTFDATWHEGPIDALGPNELAPIGKPFPNVRAYVLDDGLQPVPFPLRAFYHAKYARTDQKR